MLGFITRPVRSALGMTENDLVESVHVARDVQADMLGAVQAIENATNSIERHVEVIETLATSVDPLRASVDRLTDTMQELVALMAPMGESSTECTASGAYSVDTVTTSTQRRKLSPSRNDFKPPNAVSSA